MRNNQQEVEFMSSGYTRPLEKGEDISFEEFVLHCATAFFYDMSQLPEEFTPSSYVVEGLKKARRRLDAVESWDDEEAERQAAKAFRRRYREFVQSLIGRNGAHYRYDQMLQRVKAWQPPTPGHDALKKFMIEQLEVSIKHDCTGWPLTPPKRLTGLEYKSQQLSSITGDIDYFTKHHEGDVEQAQTSTDWVRDLRASLAQEAT